MGIADKMLRDNADVAGKAGAEAMGFATFLRIGLVALFPAPHPVRGRSQLSVAKGE